MAGTQSALAAPAVAVQGSAAAAGPAADRANPVAQAVSPKVEKNVSWLQEHLLGVMTALLALIVLVIAWLLRRANNTRDELYDGAQVTEAMVREKLQNIDLDLTSGTGEAPRRST